jgi:hypothetical protein
VTWEVWWDPRGGLFRTVYRYDDRVVSDIVQRGCQGSGRARFCIPPSPFDLAVRGLGWPPKSHFARQVGTGRFRHRPVVWIEGGGTQVAYAAPTHEPVAVRTIVRGGRFDGRVFSFDAIRLLPNLPADRVSFAVPDGGAPRNAGLKQVDFRKSSLATARAVLGRAPLWLGPRFRGHRLRFVQTARTGGEAGDGGAAGLVPFVRLDYGAFRIDELGRELPLWFSEPPPGVVWAHRGLDFAFARSGVLVTVVGTGVPVRATVDAALVAGFAKALHAAPPVNGPAVSAPRTGR